MRDFTLEEVKNAIAYYRQTFPYQGIDWTNHRQTLRLTDCLRKSWWKMAQPDKSQEEEEFEKWYAEALASGKSRRRADFLAQPRPIWSE